MPIYMKYDGIDGSVTAQGHEKWIELSSAQLGINRNITDASGVGVNREGAVPSMSEIVCTKVQDDASAKLFQSSLWGKGKLVKIDFVKTEQGTWSTYLALEMENTLVSSYNVSGHGGPNADSPMESFSLNFTKITYVQTHADPTNAAGKPERYFWDLAKGTGG